MSDVVSSDTVPLVPPVPPVPLLNVAEVAAYLHASSSFVYTLMKRGKLRHYSIGGGQGGKRCSLEHVQEYLRAVERGGGANGANGTDGAAKSQEQAGAQRVQPGNPVQPGKRPRLKFERLGL